MATFPCAVQYSHVAYLFYSGSLYLPLSNPCLAPSPFLFLLATTSSLYLWVGFCFVIYIHLFYFLDFIYNWYIEYLYFSVWRISVRIIPSRSIHIVANGRISFFFMANVLHLIHLSVDEQLACFHILAIINNAVHVSFWIIAFIFFAYISSSRIAGSYSSSMVFLRRRLHSVFHSGCANL